LPLEEVVNCRLLCELVGGVDVLLELGVGLSEEAL